MEQSLLEIKSLTLGFSNDKEKKVIFENINATASEGEFIALIGSNGRGKSTLLKTIAGIQPIFEAKENNPKLNNRGEILFNNRKISDFSNKELSQMISFVASHTERANHLTVKDMLSINCYYKTNWLGTITEDDNLRITRALEMVGLQGFEERNSYGLSDGEYQRATIAAAIVQDSSIIILDEPTAFLDIANRFTITKLLQEISHKTGKLIIFSTHDLQLAIDMCDKIWLMTSEGFHNDTPSAIMEKGAFEKLFSNPNMHFNKATRSFEMR
ncbi:MAG: ABC transporter ATP-binding protein [Bacteroidales bacterium]|nr:ABC transporter ATP-binding protein [Bacteroidales bacterium]